MYIAREEINAMMITILMVVLLNNGRIAVDRRLTATPAIPIAKIVAFVLTVESVYA